MLIVNSGFGCILRLCRETAAQRRASAAGVLRPELMQAKRDNLTATPLAGHDYRQVYFHEGHHTSAKIHWNAARLLAPPQRSGVG